MSLEPQFGRRWERGAREGLRAADLSAEPDTGRREWTFAPQWFMAGYSGKPLAEKLGVKAGLKVSALNAPERMGPELASVVEGATELGPEADLVLFFTSSSDQLATTFPKLIRNTAQNGSIWISWPKKSSKVPTDLDENIVRDTGLAAGVVDVKVCAIDEVWSGLKFVRRLKDRKGG